MWEVYRLLRRRGNYFHDYCEDEFVRGDTVTLYARREVGTRRHLLGFVSLHTFKVRGRRAPRPGFA